jgi:hypothetical protein
MLYYLKGTSKFIDIVVQERQRAAEEEEARQLAAAAAEAERIRAERCRVCCIVGPPGSIKGKLCELITQVSVRFHISTRA